MVDAIAQKRCGTCSTTKPVDGFARNRSSRDGLQARCRECVRAYYLANKERIDARVRDYAEANRERVLAYKREYNERHRERIAAKKKECYERSRAEYIAKNRARYRANREAHMEAQAAWVAANRDKVRLIKSLYKHRRRALEAQNGVFEFSDRDARRLLERHNHACAYCKLRFNADRRVTWDHVIPVTRGGSYGVGNLVPACGSCNSSKQHRTVTEWRHRMQAL